jgi:hypothetical protein
MARRMILNSAAALVVMAAATIASGQVLPTCRVRVVKSAATEAVARSIVSQVEQCRTDGATASQLEVFPDRAERAPRLQTARVRLPQPVRKSSSSSARTGSS